MHSVVLIVPAALLTQANALAEAMGFGPNNYTVPLSADGSEPATHYGLHTWAEQSFVDMLEGAAQGVMPQELIDAGYAPEDFAAVVGGLVSSVRDAMDGHFAEVCVGQNMRHEQIPNL